MTQELNKDPQLITLSGVTMLDYGVYNLKPSKFDGEPRYTARFILDKSNPEHVEMAAAIQAGEQYLIDENYPKSGAPVGFRFALNDGDETDRQGRRLHPEMFAGKWFITAKSKNRPQFYIGPKQRVANDADAENIIGSGNIVIAGIRLFHYAMSGSKGISAGLNLIWIVQKGKPIGGNYAEQDAMAKAAASKLQFDEALTESLDELL